MSERIKIQDIAQRAGVSVASVSLVLNNKPGVGAEKRNQILEIARSLKYGSEKAAALTTNKTATIRFLRTSRHGHVVNSDHSIFIANYIEGLSQKSRELGLNFEIITIENGPIESIVRIAGENRINGSIVLGTEMRQEDIRMFQSVEVPVLFIDTYDEISNFDFVDMNNKDSVFKVVSHLVENGHQDIGIVTSEVTTRNFKLRTDAFREALSYYNLPFNKDNLFVVDSTFQGAYQDILTSVAARKSLPSALFCVNDIMALGTIKALKELGIKVPEDISIIGFDNLPSAAMSDPPLTTIEVSKVKIGSLAVERLFDRINSRTPQPSIKILVSGELVKRESVRKK